MGDISVRTKEGEPVWSWEGDRGQDPQAPYSIPFTAERVKDKSTLHPFLKAAIAELNALTIHPDINPSREHRLLLWHFRGKAVVHLQEFTRQKDRSGQDEQFWQTLATFDVTNGKTQKTSVNGRDLVITHLD